MKLLIEDDQGNRSVVPVIRDEITIGRNEGNTIRLTERNVSRQHARLVQKNGTLYVEDVKARYGIKKNGQKIEERAEFGEGDVVLIGDYRLTLRPEKAEKAQPADVNGANATEISPELQQEPTKVKEVDDVQGAPPSQASPSSETEVIQTDPAKLVVVSSNFAGQKFPLDREEMVIGRGEECDIIIDHRSVSTTHAKIIRESAQTYKIVDLNSRNGIKVSGEDYKSVHLERGDVVELGHVRFRFVEPGENYEFTPQSQPTSDEFTFETEESSSLNPIAMVGIGVVAVGAVFGIVMAMSSGSDSTDEPQKSKATAKAPDEKTNQKEQAKSDETNQKVQETIEQAESDIENGKLEKAIGALESTQKLLEPTPDQSGEIDDLLSKARNEQPFRRRFESARQALRNANPDTALEDLEKIPEHSVFFSLAKDESLEKKALDALIEQANKAIDDEEIEKAKKHGELALSYDSHKKKAKSLLEKVEQAEETEDDGTGRVVAHNPGNTGSSGGSRSGSTGSGTGQSGGSGSSGGSAPPSNTVSAAEAKELKKSATKKWIRGNHSGAIRDCRKALEAGHHACYRIIGMANKQMGNTGSACRNFKRYLSTNPSDASKIRNLMDELGCK